MEEKTKRPSYIGIEFHANPKKDWRHCSACQQLTKTPRAQHWLADQKYQTHVHFNSCVTMEKKTTFANE